MNISMNTDSSTSQSAPVQPRPALEAIATALASITRWQILSALSTGEALMVTEIAERIGISPNLTSRHLAGMREAGLVVVGRNRLYQIPKQYLPSPGQRVVDFSHCLLRLDATQ